MQRYKLDINLLISLLESRQKSNIYIFKMSIMHFFPFCILSSSSPSLSLYLRPFFYVFPTLDRWHRSLPSPHLSSCHLLHPSLLPTPLCFVLFKVGLSMSVSVCQWQWWWITDTASVVSDDHNSWLMHLCRGNYLHIMQYWFAPT